MNIAFKKSLISIPLAISLTGCAISNPPAADIGKIVGAGSGATIGAVIGKEVGGDAGLLIGLGIGALVGGIAGYFVGNYIDERREAQLKISQEKGTKIEFENLAKGEEKQMKDKAIISDKGQFKTDSAVLNKDAREFYTLLAKTYKEQDKKILIVGHTDDTGKESYNQTLSQKRAKAVGEIFAKNGVNIKNIYYQGAGSTKPRADNSTASGRELNRRVEIVELDSTSDVALYASAATQNSHYLRKNQPKKQPTQSKKVAQKKDKKPSKAVAKNLVDFGGKPSKGGLLALNDEFGTLQSSGFFTFATQARADNIMLSCLNTQYKAYQNTPVAKSLASGKSLPRTSEHKRGLNGGAWMAQIQDHLIGVAPVAVLNNAKVAKNPELYIYKEYIAGSKSKADNTIKAKVSTSQGSDGLLYRVYASNKDSSIKCMDIVFDNKVAAKAKGYLYYSDANGEILEKEFKLEPIKN